MVEYPSPVTKYYTVLNHYNNFRTVKSQRVCEVCFGTDCKHDVKKIKRSEALEALTYWVEIFKMHTKDKMEWVEDDIVFPFFPITGTYDSTVQYNISPRLNLPISVVHVADQPYIFTNGIQTYVDLPRLTVKATHYGYILHEQFYGLKSFKHGYFYNMRGKMKKVTDITDNELVIGFHHLENGNVNHDQFIKTACVT